LGVALDEEDGMPSYSIAEFKMHFSSLVNRALAGEEVIVTRNNRPLLKLVPIESLSTRRIPGSARGRVNIAVDFDATPQDFAEYTDLRT
jgi:prevent-host-death family protein